MKLFFAALLSALLVGAASPAVAERISIKDPARDHIQEGDNTDPDGDVIRVRVDHAPRRVFVDTVFRTGPYENLDIYLDTRKARSGPEFMLLKTYLGFTLWRFVGKTGTERVKCADRRIRYLPRKRTWATYVNRACLRHKGKTPRRVRVKVLSASDDYYFTLDHVPGKHRYSRWVRHN